MSVSAVPSPCVRSCCLGLDDVCIGCGRHLSEITGWQGASEDQKQLINQLAADRLQVKKEARIHLKTKQVPE